MRTPFHRSIAVLVGLLFGFSAVVPRPAQAARTLPFHSQTWLTWMRPDVSQINLYGGNLDGISVFAYAFDQQDNLIPEDSIVDGLLTQMNADRRDGRRPTFLTIVNDHVTGEARHAGDVRFDPDLVQRILSDPAKRARLVAQIAAQAPKADGIDIDFEAMHGITMPFFTEFIKELRAAIGPTKLLAVNAQPKTTTVPGPRGQAIDWQGILPYIDQLRVLTYYYSYSGSAPGPVVTMNQLNALIDFALNNQKVPIQKLRFVFSVFGWDWPNNGQPGQIVEYDEALNIARAHGVTPFRDPASGVVRINYTDGGVAHQIWIDDFQSLQPKIMRVLESGIRFVDFWAIGGGDPRLWQWIANNTTNIPDPTDVVTPVITQLQPSTARPGSPSFTLNVFGDNFETGAVVRWNGQPRPTTFSSATRLIVTIPASDVAAAGAAAVTVFNPVNNRESNRAVFSIAAAPIIDSLSPSSARENGPAFTLSILGSGFTPNSIGRWGPDDRPTTFVSANRIDIAIAQSDLTFRGTIPISVINPLAEGGQSNSKTFTVRLVPAINSLSPGTAFAGGPSFTLTVDGGGFDTDSVVTWNGQNLTTTFVSSRTLTAVVPAANIASPGRIPVAVVNAVIGGTSSPRPFIVNPPGSVVPFLAGVNPPAVRMNSPDVTVQVLGRDFLNGAIVEWEGVARPTTYVSRGELRAVFPAADLVTPGRFSITVANPAPRGGTSNATLFVVDASAGPRILAVDPPFARAGGPGFTLTMDGENFDPAAIGRWNNLRRPSTFVSPTRITMQVSAADIAAAGFGTLRVSNPTVGSAFWTYPILSTATPVLTSLNPASIGSGGPDFPLTVRGRGFTVDSVVYWNGEPRPTTFGSGTSITATISAADRATPATVQVSVVDGINESNTLPFTIYDGTLQLFSLTPSSTTAGSGGFTMVVRGQNFATGAVVQWNGSPRTTTFVSSTTVRAAIARADLVTAGTIPITVISSSQTSNSLPFEIVASTIPPPGPGIIRLSPAVGVAGGPGFTLTVTGRDLTPTSVIQWNGQPRATTFVSTTTVQAPITAADRAVPGSIPVTVADGPSLSNTLFFTVTGSTPSVSVFALSPSTAAVGGPAFTLTVFGRGFGTAANVTWNGQARPTTFVSSTTVRAAIAAADIAVAATVPVAVVVGTQTSNALPFVIGEGTGTASGVPVLTSVSPSSTTAGSSPFSVTITGDAFRPDSVVQWNGSDLPTTFVSATQLQAAVAAALVANVGQAAIAVVNPGPGGGTSNLGRFDILPAPVAAGVADLGERRVYPNPWDSDTHSNVGITFDNLTVNSTIKLFTLSGRWVRTLQAPTGSVTWDLRNDSGDRVASGYYIYLITDSQDHQARGKIAIVK